MEKLKKLWIVIIDHLNGKTNKDVAIAADGAQEVAQRPVGKLIELDLDGEVHILCDNCKSPITGGFCASCGQKNASMMRPIWFLLSDLTEDIISKDSKLFRTLGQLMLYPGSLTRDFMDGKRARFIPPVRFYLLSTLLFFITIAMADVAILKIEFKPNTLLEGVTNAEEATKKIREDVLAGLAKQGITPDMPGLENLSPEDREMLAIALAVDEPKGEGEQSASENTSDPAADESQNDQSVKQNIGQITKDGQSLFDISGGMFLPAEPSKDSYVLPDDAFEDQKKDLNETLEKNDLGTIPTFVINRSMRAMDGIIHVSQDPRRLNTTLNDWISRAMIFVLPFFALILRFFYWSRENCLMKQLVFSLHFHSALFLMMTFLVISQNVWGAKFSASIFYFIVPFYLFVAMKVSSKQGWFRTFFKFFMVSLIYLIFLSITVAFTLMISFSEI